MEMTSTLESFIHTCDSMMITTESSNLAEVSTFIEDPDTYLDTKYENFKMTGNELLYTEILKTDGCLYAQIMSVCTELEKVNAYHEALIILDKIISILERMIPEIAKEDQDNLNWTINEFKSRLLSIKVNRDEYTSNRRGILEKYKDICNACL